jgi:hypothetical protein
VSQRVSLYTVRLRAKRGGPQPLAGLISMLASELDGFVEASEDGLRFVRAVSAKIDGDDLFVLLQHGESGVAAQIVSPDGEVRLRQLPGDAQLVRCACLFRLPADAREGSLAIHVNDGRGLKELLEGGLRRRFAARAPGLTLAFTRPVQGNLLQQAVAADRVEKVKLVRLERAGDRGIAALDKWVPTGSAARIELDVGGRIEPGLIRRYLKGDSAAFAEIVEFAGMKFDGAKVEVRLPDDTRRLFDLAHPDQGRPVTRELAGLTFDDGGEPTEASLRAELIGVLDR